MDHAFQLQYDFEHVRTFTFCQESWQNDICSFRATNVKLVSF